MHTYTPRITTVNMPTEISISDYKQAKVETANGTIKQRPN